jgi:hypothetical protein
MSSGGAIIDPRSELSILENHEYEKGLKQIFNLLTIRGEYQVIGSGAIEEIKYGSDYDLQEFVKESDYQKSTKHLLDLFRKKFEMALQDPEVFILDFKCGVDDEGDAIRWNKKTIKAGHQKVDGRKITFQECLLMKSTIKMDITALVDGVFIEFSDNYYLTLKDFNTFTAVAKSHEDILYSLQHESAQKYHHGDFWKASKRIFAYMKSKGGHIPQIKQLVNYFNTDTGRLSKNRSELDIIALVVDNKFRKPKKTDVVRNLRIVEQDVAKLHGYKLTDFHAKINAICKISNVVKMKEPIEELSAYLKAEVNKTTKLFLDAHNQITKLILNPFEIKKIKGGSKNSGFVQKMIASKQVDIRKVKNPSAWLEEHHGTHLAENIQMSIEDKDVPASKKKGRPVKHATAKEKYDAKLLSNKLKRQEKRQKAKADAEPAESAGSEKVKELKEAMKFERTQYYALLLGEDISSALGKRKGYNKNVSKGQRPIDFYNRYNKFKDELEELTGEKYEVLDTQAEVKKKQIKHDKEEAKKDKEREEEAKRNPPPTEEIWVPPKRKKSSVRI